VRHYGLDFKDTALLKQALTHRSYLSVTGGLASESNERLEFLGDSVLGLVTSEHLFRTRPSEHEGQLTKTKSLLVSKAILSRRALAMGLGKFVLMSHSEIESGGRQRLSILADAFESVIGAIYLDLGFEAARGFIERWLLDDAPEIVADKRHVNYKSHLQEYVQSTFRTHPVYRIRSEMGPDHSKHFMVEVAAGRRVLGEGRGKNKKEAEQAAARQALDRVSESRGREGRERPDREPPRDRPDRELPRDRDRDRQAQREPREHHDRREPRESRERTEPRESRERMEPRDREAARHDAPRHDAPQQAGTFIERGPETERAAEGESGRRGRRRGRRGGRGLRRPEGVHEGGSEIRSAETGETKAPAQPGPTATPAPQRPVVARGPMREPRFERPREIEPLPPAAAEDDIEEIGRPEGPPGERFVDPYATRSPIQAEPRIAPMRPASVEPQPPRGEPQGGGNPPDTSDDPWTERIESEAADASQETGEKRPDAAEPGAAERSRGPIYGRRRGRRN
jgi:ribonuclease III